MGGRVGGCFLAEIDEQYGTVTAREARALGIGEQLGELGIALGESAAIPRCAQLGVRCLDVDGDAIGRERELGRHASVVRTRHHHIAAGRAPADRQLERCGHRQCDIGAIGEK